MAWRGGYQQRFVSASSSSSATSGVPTHRYPSSSAAMNQMPPPMELTAPNAAAVAAGAAPMFHGVPPPATAGYHGARAREEQRMKEDEFMSLVSGAKKVEKERRQRLYEDEYLEKEDSDDEDSKRRSGRDRDHDRDRDRYKDSRRDRSRERDRDRRRSRSRERESRREPEKKVEPVEEDEDELDAFMAGVNAQATKEKAEAMVKDHQRIQGKAPEEKDKGLGRADIDEEDMQESYFNFLDEKKAAANEDEDIYEYDEDGNIKWTWKKVIDPLPDLDHSTVDYKPFHKNFYHEHEDIQKLNFVELSQLRDKLGIKIGGSWAPKPVASFAHFGFDEALMKEIRKSEYEHPTPIQAQSIPAALSGRDVLGIAKTGSGKTAAYLWPAIVHIMDQADLEAGDGPVGLIVVPTRELAIQVYQEAKKFCRAYNINVICAYGGGSKYEQSQELINEGAELVVCTPGRIIDLVKMGATNFTRVTYLVFDEADRMFDMGFEAQVMSISNHIRPDRQCLMFSATFKAKVEKLARDALKDPVRIVQGEVGEANEDIVQVIDVLPNQEAKWKWLCSRLVSFISGGKVLVFVTKKLHAEELANNLKRRDFNLVLLHGDMQQHERNEHLKTFRGKGCDLLVATDVAARGLDIPEIRTVVNYDIARDIDTHVHRIGRTGRAGERGWAYTLMTEADKELAGHYVRNLESVNQEVPKALLDLALKAPWFKASRRDDGTSAPGANPQARFGLGYKPKTRAAVSGPRGKEHDPLTANLSKPGVSMGFVPPVGGGGGPMSGTGKMGMLKNSFKAAFAHSFRPASQSEAPAVASDPRPEWKKRIDSLNQKFTAQHQAQQSSSGEEGEAPTKKNRWQQ